MTYTEWTATVERGVTITPEMAFEAGRQAERKKCATLCYEQNWLIHGSEMAALIEATKEE